MGLSITELARRLEPFVAKMVTIAAGGAGPFATSPHDMQSSQHTGSISDAQGPQFLLVNGGRTLVGNLPVADGITIDGVDLSAFNAVQFIVAAPSGETPNELPLVSGDGTSVSFAGGEASVSVDTSVARDDWPVIAGAGLIDGGNLSPSGVTINVGAGDGIDVNPNDIAVDSSVARDTWPINAGSGLIGGGNLSPTGVTVNIGQGAGITVNVDDVAVNQAYDFTWTGEHAFQATMTARNIIPEATDSYDLGSSLLLWRKGWLSELDTVLFAENTITLLGGWFYVTKDAGAVAAEVLPGATQIDFGKAMTPGDFVIFRASTKVEYMSVGSLVGGTTYNVTRNLDGSGADTWPAGAPFAVLGQSGDGRIELNAYDTPRVSVVVQGAAYNAQNEYIRLGDLNGMPGVSTQKWGVFIGDASQHLKYYDGALVIAGIGPQFTNTAENVDAGEWIVGASASATQSADPHTGIYAMLLTSSAAGDASGAISSGEVGLMIPVEVTRYFTGRRIKIEFWYKQPASNPATACAAAYSTNSVGNSGWQAFTPTTSWQRFSFVYDVPSTNLTDDYLTFDADTTNAGKGVLIDDILIELVNAGEDVTNINGGNIQTNTITVNKLTTGELGVSKTLIIGTVANNKGRIVISTDASNNAKIEGIWRDGSGADTVQAYFGTDGKLYAGATAVVLDAAGIALATGTGITNMVKWLNASGQQVGTIYASYNTGAAAELVIAQNKWSASLARITISAGGQEQLILDTSTDARLRTYQNFYVDLFTSGKVFGVRNSLGATKFQVDDSGNLTLNGYIVEDSWTNATLQNNWQNFGAGWPNASYFKDKNGIVHLRGLVKSGIAYTIFTLPAGYRPATYEMFTSMTDTGICRLDVQSGGAVALVSGPYVPGTGWVTLCGFTFRAA